MPPNIFSRPVGALLTVLAIAIMTFPGYSQDLWRGVDLSYVNEMEDCGAVYRYEGEITDPYAIFANKGANIVRFRLWHDPDWTEYSTLADVTPKYPARQAA